MTPDKIAKLPKWAQEYIESIKQDGAIRAALRWPDYPKPEPVDTAKELEGKPFGTLFVGWWFNAYRGEISVGQGCCDKVHHSNWSTTKTNTQGTGRFYRTELEAWQAARHDASMEMAKTLAIADRRIAELIAKSNEAAP